MEIRNVPEAVIIHGVTLGPMPTLEPGRYVSWALQAKDGRWWNAATEQWQAERVDNRGVAPPKTTPPLT